MLVRAIACGFDDERDGTEGVVVGSCLRQPSALNGNNVVDVVLKVSCFDLNQAAWEYARDRRWKALSQGPTL